MIQITFCRWFFIVSGVTINDKREVFIEHGISQRSVTRKILKSMEKY